MRNNRKKSLKIISFLAIILVVLAACGSSGEGAANESGSSEEGTTVNVATAGTGPPYSHIDTEGNWTGTEADIWSEISERTGWNINVQRVGNSSSALGQLDSGRSNVAANNYALTEERAQNYIYTTPLYADANTVAVQSGNDEINTLDDLEGKTIGVMAGQAADIPLTEMADEVGFEVIRFETTTDTFQQLAIDRVDAAAGPRSLLNEYNERTGADFKILEENLTATPIVYFLSDTEENTQLRDELNTVIEEMIADGTIGQITEEWLYTDMTQNLEDAETEQQ